MGTVNGAPILSLSLNFLTEVNASRVVQDLPAAEQHPPNATSLFLRDSLAHSSPCFLFCYIALFLDPERQSGER